MCQGTFSAQLVSETSSPSDILFWVTGKTTICCQDGEGKSITIDIHALLQIETTASIKIINEKAYSPLKFGCITPSLLPQLLYRSKNDFEGGGVGRCVL
jgi:hypothetical protein